ncbi:alkaline phosphatase D family protein [Sphingomonas sp. DT-51]|uniref:alkaline phosphatase D family protein n=1 Tax=Sphingomonas sp. DT-51 TaxID=3396165 RepID=UPI003F19BFB8
MHCAPPFGAPGAQLPFTHRRSRWRAAVPPTALTSSTRRKGAAPEPYEHAAVLAARARPSRELLGAEQQRWLEDVLARSVEAGKPWQLPGNQVVMARVAGLKLPSILRKERFAAMLAKLPEQWRARLQASFASTARVCRST